MQNKNIEFINTAINGVFIKDNQKEKKDKEKKEKTLKKIKEAKNKKI